LIRSSLKDLSEDELPFSRPAKPSETTSLFVGLAKSLGPKSGWKNAASIPREEGNPAALIAASGELDSAEALELRGCNTKRLRKMGPSN
jgi:hypothetical protein